MKPESLLLTLADAAYHSLKVCFTAGDRRRAGNRRMGHLLPSVSPSPSQHMILSWTMLADVCCVEQARDVSKCQSCTNRLFLLGLDVAIGCANYILVNRPTW